MKKLLSILALVLFFAGIANAQAPAADFNKAVTATSQFDCRVIVPLAWEAMSNVTLEECIAGQTRDITNVPITFTLNGEAGYAVTVHQYGPTPDGDVGSVSLEGSWDAVPTAIGSAGSVTTTYTVDKIVSGSTSDTGLKCFHISVDAVYSGI